MWVMWGQICGGTHLSPNVVTAISASFNEYSTVTLFNLFPILCCVINSETRYITQENFFMAQRFSYRTLTRSIPMSLNKGFVYEESGTGTSFHRVERFALFSIVPPMLHKLHSNIADTIRL